MSAFATTVAGEASPNTMLRVEEVAARWRLNVRTVYSMIERGEAKEKKSIYKGHLKKALGKKRLDEIGVSEIAQLRAKLVKAKLSDKRVNNILAVLSKPLRYASDVGLIAAAPRVGLIKVERPEFICWDIDEYARILAAARNDDAEWYAAVCLAGEAGLRVGEVRALRWKEDVDMLAGTTVNQQIRQGMLGTPKGRTRRTVPMTETLREALKRLAAIGGGYVLKNADGGPKTDGQTGCAIHRIYDRAGLGERDGGWHVLRHSFGTHAALFGVNPWTLMP
jgi:integrase